ncbi:MAG: hypothetical protein ACLPN1_09760 [Dissulfurispiraceae bacterium]
MRPSISKHEIFVKLQAIVNSKDGLWWKMRDLARTDDYLIISDFYGKILKKLDVLETDLGPTAEIVALREAILGLNRNSAGNAETKEIDNGSEVNRTA